MFKSGVTIPILAGEFSYGAITIPPGLIPAGWSVTITAVEKNDLKKPKPTKDDNSGCGDSNNKDSSDDNETGELATVGFDMTIRDENGKERSLANLLQKASDTEGIGIRLVYSLTKEQQMRFSEKDLRYIYLENGDEAWKFVDAENKILKPGSFGNITTTVDHLTSMSQILESSSGASPISV